PTFNGNLTINATVGENFLVFIENDGEQIEPTIVDGKISETIEVESYTSVLVVIIPMGAETALEVELVGPALGSEARPIEVWDIEQLVDIDVSNGVVYYRLPSDYDGYKMNVIGDDKAYVMMNGTRYDCDEAIALAAVNYQIVVGFGSDAADASTVTAEIEFPAGHEYNPLVLNNGDVAIKIPEGINTLYGIYTAPADGVLTLTPADAQFSDITLVNGDNYAWLDNGEGIQASVSIEVKAGDVVEVYFAPGMDEDLNVIVVDTTVKVEGPVAAKNGWVLEDGKWAFYVDDVKVTDKWMKDSKGWCYLGSDGYWVTNAWVKDSVTWCYIGSDGYCVTNKWVKDSTGWCYLGSDGRMVTNAWVKDSVGWCYVGADGYCVTNKWVKDSTGWCYIGSEGRMLTNAWVKDSKGWCYLDANGYCLVDTTATIDGVKYTFDKNGNWVA
ncbi:MAG: hypothetical protein IKU51_00695, partial [Clostridia bacterium]|nr:hypothetical protein [Clostridia bacterium]